MTEAPPAVFAWSFPNPITWVVDEVAGFIGDVATAGFELVIGGLVAWVVDAVIWVVGGVFDFFLDAQDPNVQADWFITGTGPYATTAGIAGTLMVAFVLAGIAQGAVQGDVGGMLRRMALDLPLSVLGIVGLVTATQALIRLTDELSTQVMANFETDIADFTAVVVSLSRLASGYATALVIFILGLVTVMAGLVLVAELAIRAALVYIVVALAPLVFAAQLWPALKGTGQKLLRLLCGLILSKLAMAVALSVAASAAVGTGSGGEVTSLPEPEVFAEDPGGSVTQAVGILLAATAAFGVAAFMPFLVVRLLPLAEDAAIAQGVRGGPLRTAQQGMSLAYYAQSIPRLARGARGMAKGPKPGPPGQGMSPRTPSAGRPQLPAGAQPKGALPMGPRPMPPGPAGGSGVGGGLGGSGTGGAGSGALAGAAGGPVGVAATAATSAASVAKRGLHRAARAAEQSAITGVEHGRGTTAPASSPASDRSARRLASGGTAAGRGDARSDAPGPSHGPRPRSRGDQP